MFTIFQPDLGSYPPMCSLNGSLIALHLSGEIRRLESGPERRLLQYALQLADHVVVLV